MVGTALISGSLVLNDSTGRFQEDEARQTLGEIDEVVQQTGQRVPSDRRPIPLFDVSVAGEITPQAVRDSAEPTYDERTATGRMLVALGLNGEPAGVDGVLAVLTGELPAESLDEAGETEVATPAVTVVGASTWEELGSFGEESPSVAEHPEPEVGEVYISEGMAEGLELREGSGVRLVGRGGPEEFTVSAGGPGGGISGYEGGFSGAVGAALGGEEAARRLFGAGGGQGNAG